MAVIAAIPELRLYVVHFHKHVLSSGVFLSNLRLCLGERWLPELQCQPADVNYRNLFILFIFLLTPRSKVVIFLHLQFTKMINLEILKEMLYIQCLQSLKPNVSNKPPL